MRNRKYNILIRLYENEYISLRKKVKQSNLSQEGFMRHIINGVEIRQSPPLQYHELIKQLLAIGKNINQIAFHAHATNKFEESEYRKNYQELLSFILFLQKQIE